MLQTNTMAEVWEFTTASSSTKKDILQRLSDAQYQPGYESWTPEFVTKLDAWWQAAVREDPSNWSTAALWWRIPLSEGIDWSAWSSLLVKNQRASLLPTFFSCAPDNQITWSPADIVDLTQIRKQASVSWPGYSPPLLAFAELWAGGARKIKNGPECIAAAVDMWLLRHAEQPAPRNGCGGYWLLWEVGCRTDALATAIEGSAWDKVMRCMKAGDYQAAAFARPGLLDMLSSKATAVLEQAGVQAVTEHWRPESIMSRLLAVPDLDWPAIAPTLFRAEAWCLNLGVALKQLALGDAWGTVAPVWRRAFRGVSGENCQDTELNRGTPEIWSRFLSKSAVKPRPSGRGYKACR